MATKAKPVKGSNPEDEAPDEEEESSDDKGSEDDGGAGNPPGDLESSIRKVVREVVDGLLGDRTPASKGGPAADEASVFKMVQDAQSKLKKEEEKDSKFAEVAETVESLK